MRREIRLDLPRVDIYSVEDIALTPFFYINLDDTDSPDADLQGRCITVASPEDGLGNFWNVGTIVEVGVRDLDPGPLVFNKGYLKVLDGEKNMLDALANNEALGATVYTFHDKATYGSAQQHTFGEWSHTPVNSGGTTGTTAFRDSAGDIKTFMKGWLLVPAVTELGYLQITDVDTSLDKVIVKGDADTISGVGQRYWLVAPAGVNPETGAIETDPCKMGSPWLWAGYLYRAPIVGFSNPPGQSAGTYGAQSGLNKVGNYQCWNRIYEPSTGRWTTQAWPDLLAPNEWDYRWPLKLVRSWWGRLKDDLDFVQRLDAIRRAKTLEDFKAARDGSCGWDEVIYREGTGRILFGVDRLHLLVPDSAVEDALQEGATDKEIATSALNSYLQDYLNSLVGDDIPYLVSQVGIDHKNTKAEVAAKCPSPCHLTFYRVHLAILERSIGPARYSSVTYGQAVDEREPTYPHPPQHKKEGFELYRLMSVRALLTIKYGVYYRAICKEDSEQEERF